jgi:hypothetical protein
VYGLDAFREVEKAAGKHLKRGMWNMKSSLSANEASCEKPNSLSLPYLRILEKKCMCIISVVREVALVAAAGSTLYMAACALNQQRKNTKLVPKLQTRIRL